jgi:hypothetical protein
MGALKGMQEGARERENLMKVGEMKWMEEKKGIMGRRGDGEKRWKGIEREEKRKRSNRREGSFEMGLRRDREREREREYASSVESQWTELSSALLRLFKGVSPPVLRKRSGVKRNNVGDLRERKKARTNGHRKKRAKGKNGLSPACIEHKTIT